MITRLLATTATGLFLISGTAHAAPVKGQPTLTHNAIYKKGVLPKVSCKAVKGTTRASTEKYVRKLVSCLNTAWKGTIDGFQQVAVTFKSDKESCSTGVKIAGSYSEICGQTIEVRLADDWIKAKNDVHVFGALMREWSGVVQGQTGIGRAYWNMPNDRTGEDMAEQRHRFYLQADCLAGVSAKTLGRKITDFKPFIAGMEPREYARYKWNGSPANRLHWTKKGYQAGKPGACNTWTASAPKVA
ncbi:hypothetical protein FDA94_09845 [Herbidospora galbida]|uniref:Metalloprotease n=1 Tax=Herbidospora galbida TaxID=2575442 RepID=A0A4U3MIN6_9ACTN|nr:hypothetical protein [Herbidospora galbida]TKK89235.1 hypothetical protein FDA94_09845 [Herbidospora galbida]